MKSVLVCLLSLQFLTITEASGSSSSAKAVTCPEECDGNYGCGDDCECVTDEDEIEYFCTQAGGGSTADYNGGGGGGVDPTAIVQSATSLAGEAINMASLMRRPKEVSRDHHVSRR
uniref:Putative secreted protein n=1 Tax=Amblyomma parvum TaxID=251391 RepID=A0A023FZ56_AMBPA